MWQRHSREGNRHEASGGAQRCTCGLKLVPHGEGSNDRGPDPFIVPNNEPCPCYDILFMCE
ncbi:Os08g0451650 [Oryza sativa Japonica Group]|uniref:Os08g0451650 protein n=1 Tax=Oryza sativa subsp. japonica TaxID=39947 RepID=C7J6C5_ORYSJ|nr:Os08g0451650 [Oryza sativa Japonica Group]|eukprot:NP_001175606.1 Os08g0451650 [Oryza sativa Japonica Group]